MSLCTSDERGLNTIFSSKRPMSSGRKNRCNSEITARSSVVKGRRVGRKKLLRSDVAGADNVETGKVTSIVVGKCYLGRIEHLQKKVPDQAMGLFNFVKQKNAPLTLRKDGSQAPRPAGFVAHEQLGAINDPP